MGKAGLFPLVVAIAAPIILMATTVLLLISPKKRAPVEKNVEYYDRYLEIYPDHMILSGFYFGPIGRKRIAFDSVGSIEVISLNFWNGRYRIQGTGDFGTWFTHDIDRPSKDRAFAIHRIGKWWRIAFSAEDFDKVAAIFEAKGLLHRAGTGQTTSPGPGAKQGRD